MPSLVYLYSAVLVAMGASTIASPLQRRTLLDNPGTCHLDGTAPMQLVGEIRDDKLTKAEPFCETAWPSGDIVKSFTTYSDGNSLKGISLTYSSGKVVKRGGGFEGDESGSITFAPDEAIQYIAVGGTGKGDGVGRIRVETSAQKKDLGNADSNLWGSPIGGGIMVGITGYVNTEDDGELFNMAIILIGQKVKAVNFINYEFDTDPLTGGPGFEPETLSKVHYYNADPKANGTYSFAGTRSATSTNTLSQTTTGTFGMHAEWEASAEILGVGAKASGGWSWSIERSTMSSTEKAETNSLTWTQNGALLPGKAVDCSAIVYVGKGDFPYKCTVSLSLEGGGTFTYPEEGTLRSVQYTQIDQECKPSAAQSAPSGFKAGSIARVTKQQADTP